MLSPEGYRAACHTAAIISLSTRGLILVTGDDRVSYLQGLLSNDIAALEPGQGCYATYLTPQGRMLADLCVLNLGDSLLLDVHSSVTSMLVDRLREFVFMEQVTVHDQTSVWAGFGIHGPEAAGVLARVVQLTSDAGLNRTPATELAALQEHQHLAGRYDGMPAIVVRSNEIGEVGFLVYTEAARVEDFGQALSEAGAKALDVETFDLLRLEAGRPVFPTDMDQDTIPLEAGIEDRAISLNKGCYVGQEVIVRILHRGQGRVARRLVGLWFDPNDVTPTAGDALTTPDDLSGKPIGVLTSVGCSPVLERPIAFGYVKRELAEVGTELVVLGLEHHVRGVVTIGPFLTLPRFG